jgi:hypothetical protein
MINKYSGSGIIPIIKHNKKIYFVLFSSGKNLITDAGGKIENNNSIASTALRELFEESCGLFNIDENTLNKKSKHIDVVNPIKDNEFYNKLYRVYFIFIDIYLPDILQYYNNLKKIKLYDFNPFAETFGIHLISLDWIHYYNNDIYMNTHTDKLKLLNIRLKIIMSNIIDKYNNLDNFYYNISKKIKLIKIKQKIIYINTYSYKNNSAINIKDIITYILS